MWPNYLSTTRLYSWQSLNALNCTYSHIKKINSNFKVLLQSPHHLSSVKVKTLLDSLEAKINLVFCLFFFFLRTDLKVDEEAGARSVEPEQRRRRLVERHGHRFVAVLVAEDDPRLRRPPPEGRRLRGSDVEPAAAVGVGVVVAGLADADGVRRRVVDDDVGREDDHLGQSAAAQLDADAQLVDDVVAAPARHFARTAGRVQREGVGRGAVADAHHHLLVAAEERLGPVREQHRTLQRLRMVQPVLVVRLSVQSHSVSHRLQQLSSMGVFDGVNVIDSLTTVVKFRAQINHGADPWLRSD